MVATNSTAFVFAGGGSLGAIQVGMLRTLLANGFEADIVVGSSVGAINAAYFAASPDAEGVTRLEGIWRGLRRADVFPFTLLDGVRGLLARRDYLVDAGALRRLLQRKLPIQRLEETRLPCHIITTDLLEGIEVRISSGPAVPALLASTAIPGVFPPVRIDGRYLIDGGAANHTPVSAALELGATRLIVLPTGYACALQSPPRGAVAIALKGLNILIVRQLIAEIRRLRDQAEILVVPPLCPVETSAYDFAHGGALIERAAEQTGEWLREGVEQVDGLPHQFPPHSHRPLSDPYAPQRI